MPQSRVESYMSSDVITVREDEPLRAAAELVLIRRVRHVPVLDGQGGLVGIVTDHDVMRALPSPLSAVDSGEYDSMLDGTPVRRVMTRQPYTVTPESLVSDAVRLMLSHKIRGLPVVRDGAVVGMFTQSDAMRGYLELLAQG